MGQYTRYAKVTLLEILIINVNVCMFTHTQPSDANDAGGPVCFPSQYQYQVLQLS